MPAVALVITTGIFVYQLRLYLRARKKNQKPTIPNFNIGPLPSPIPAAPTPQKHVEKKTPQPIKKTNAAFYYVAAFVGVALVIVMFVTLSDEPFTFVPRANSPSPTIGLLPSITAQPTQIGGTGINPSPSSVPINYALTPTASGAPTSTPSITQAAGTSPTSGVSPSRTVQPTKTTTAAPSPTKVANTTLSPSPVATSTLAANASPSPTPTPKTIAYAPNEVQPTSGILTASPTATPTNKPNATSTQGATKVTVTGSVTGQTEEIPQSGIIHPSIFLLLAGGFILFLGFLF